MLLLEIAAFLIVATYISVRLHLEGGDGGRPKDGDGGRPKGGDGGRTSGRARFLVRLFVTAVAAWLCEETCIRFYGFYSYHADWSIFVGSVPLMVLIIWPVVIHSAGDLAGRLCRTNRWVVPAAGALVFTDAALIEPVAVQAGLWRWTEPGVFNVPPIGILGWALFAALCAAVFSRNQRKGRNLWFDLSAIPISLVGCHLLLLAAWWFALRWVNVSLPCWGCASVAWAAGLYLTWRAWRARAGNRVGLIPLLVRVPAALFFMTLLVMYCTEVPYLVPYVLAFVPPYLALTFTARVK